MAYLFFVQYASYIKKLIHKLDNRLYLPLPSGDIVIEERGFVNEKQAKAS